MWVYKLSTKPPLSTVKSPPQKILLTGKPGVGKTTVVRKVTERFWGKAGGFYTEEIRREGVREGFRVRTLDGDEGVLAHVSYREGFRVSKYGVDIEAFDAIVIPSLERSLETDELLVIDEIGKMELFSNRFRSVVQRILTNQGKVLGVIHRGADPFTQHIRQLQDVLIWTVTKENRDSLPRLILRSFEQKVPGER